jgi:hypothetical protein
LKFLLILDGTSTFLDESDGYFDPSLWERKEMVAGRCEKEMEEGL